MNCMKCGAQISDNQVFCDHCLSVMETHPIRANAHVHLPKRDVIEDAGKKPVKKRRAPTLEEQVSNLRSKVKRLRLIAVILAFLLCIASAFLFLNLYEDSVAVIPGLNYTIDTSMNS